MSVDNDNEEWITTPPRRKCVHDYKFGSFIYTHMLSSHSQVPKTPSTSRSSSVYALIAVFTFKC